MHACTVRLTQAQTVAAAEAVIAQRAHEALHVPGVHVLLIRGVHLQAAAAHTP